MPTTRAMSCYSQTSSNFQGLAPELRNCIWRSLLDDLTTPSKALDLFDEELPTYYIATYSALIRTCKIIRDEVKSIFTKDYMPKMRFYFKDLRALYAFANMNNKAFWALFEGRARYVLRTPIAREDDGSVRITNAFCQGRKRVGHCFLPLAFHQAMEKLLEEGLPDGKAQTWDWNAGGGSTLPKAEKVGGQVMCTIPMPFLEMRMLGDDGEPDEPDEQDLALTYFSKFTVGGSGKTASTIEGKIRDVVIVQALYNDKMLELLESEIDDWEDALRQRVERRTDFDSLEEARKATVWAERRGGP